MTELAAGLLGTATPELQQEVEQFLYYEALLLDEHRYRDWLELLTDDIHYWMPSRSNRTAREQHLEVALPGEIAHFDEDKRSLGQRVTRLETNQAWAEDPPSRTRHMVTNVRIGPGEGPASLVVDCYFHTYRNRREHDVDSWIGTRRDVLRREGPAGFRIAQRIIVLDQSTLLAKNLSVFL